MLLISKNENFNEAVSNRYDMQFIDLKKMCRCFI